MDHLITNPPPPTPLATARRESFGENPVHFSLFRVASRAEDKRAKMGLCCRVFTCLVESWPSQVSEEGKKTWASNGVWIWQVPGQTITSQNVRLKLCWYRACVVKRHLQNNLVIYYQPIANRPLNGRCGRAVAGGRKYWITTKNCRYRTWGTIPSLIASFPQNKMDDDDFLLFLVCQYM